MSDFRVTYTVKDTTLEALTKQVYTSLYLAEIEGENVRLTDVSHGQEFEFPATQKLLKHLNEQPTPQAEGDWQIDAKQDRVGEDTE